MTTQHQAPEVTSELRECPFCGGTALTAFVQAGISWWQVECSKCTAHVDAPTEAEAITAWNTRATQPLSLTVDEGLIAQQTSAWLRQCSDWLLSNDLDMQCPMETDPLDLADALDRLQSLSGEQIAENANCSGDIDRSGLAQEVDDISYAGVWP